MAKEQLWQENCAGEQFTKEKKRKEMAMAPSGLPLHDVMFLQSAPIAKLVIVNVSLQLIDYLPYRVHVILKSKFNLLSG